MLKKIGRILIPVIIIIVGIVPGILISTVCMSIIENAGKIHMTEYFKTTMSGSIGILFGTGILFLYMKKKNTWNVILDAKEELSVKNICVYAVIAVCICKFVFEVVSPFKNLVENMNRIAAGDLNTRISIDSPNEVYLIGSTFNVMVNNLQKMQENRVKMEENNRLLYSNIAHDLKSPMTMVIGYAKVLQEDNLPEEKKKEYLGIICEQSVHMNELLDVMLSYTKLQNNSYQLVLEKMDVAELLRKCIAQYYLLFEEHGLEVDIDIPDGEYLCMVDETELLRAFQNLISNMIVHTKEGIKCCIFLQKISGEDGYNVNIYFADGGGVLPNIVKENLFQPFCVGDESRNTKGGQRFGDVHSKKDSRTAWWRCALYRKLEKWNESICCCDWSSGWR